MAALLGAVLLVGLIAWMSRWASDHQPSVWPEAIWVLLTSLPWVVLWLAGAAGLGWMVMRLLHPNTEDRFVAQLGFGVGTMLVLDSALGATGALQLGGGVGGWVLVLAGVSLLAVQLLKLAQARTSSPPACHWFIWASAPALAVLLLAACSAPGHLWASEFGGYDALSYHLQLPREWLAQGRITTLDHNVYSFLPGYMEAAYYHIMVLMGQDVGAAYACQLLHASMAILTAIVVARTVSRLSGKVAGALGAVFVLGTPWVIVTGSLAYSEMTVCLLLACAVDLALTERPMSWREGSAIGLLIGAACGAKLTALGFVLPPVLILIGMRSTPRRWLRLGASVAAATLIALSPYLLRNTIACGNPLFPFATDVFGTAHWTAEQSQRWASGHAIDASVGERLPAVWDQVMRYGIGAAPDASEPWQPQWSILPWLAIIGAAFGIAASATRSATVRLAIMLGLQLIFWLSLTHLESRFMLPAVVPMAILAALPVGALLRHPSMRRSQVVAGGLCVLAILYSSLPVWIFAQERNGAPAALVGRADLFTGDALKGAKLDAAAQSLTTVFINRRLPADARILLLGEARAFYYHADHVYQTVWDADPLGAAMAANPHDPAAWAATLRDQGFTHVLINDEMLANWTKRGWSNPLITPENVHAFADDQLLRDHVWGPLVLYRVP